jgi:hypothetical protein
MVQEFDERGEAVGVGRLWRRGLGPTTIRLTFTEEQMVELGNRGGDVLVALQILVRSS